MIDKIIDFFLELFGMIIFIIVFGLQVIVVIIIYISMILFAGFFIFKEIIENIFNSIKLKINE